HVTGVQTCAHPILSRLLAQMDYYAALYGSSKLAIEHGHGWNVRSRYHTADTRRKRGRVVEGTGLENRQGFAPFVGSNPTASASHLPAPMSLFVVARVYQFLAAMSHGSIKCWRS